MAPEESARAGLPNRRSIRKRGWDYTAPGWYFITINTHRGRALFGVIANGQIVLSAAGRVVAEEWFKSAIIRPGIELDEFVVMPNHVHGLVRLPEGRPAGRPCSPCSPCGPPPGSLGAFVAGFKGAAGRAINAARGTPGAVVWHRNYWDVIVPDARALENIRHYIRENPRNWHAVENVGAPRFLGNRALLDGATVGFLASRGAATVHGTLPVRRNEAVMSTFLSPMERAVFRALLAARRPLIWVKPAGQDEGRLAAPLRRAIDDGRLLILTPFADRIDAPSLRRALWCNHYIVRHAARLIVGHLTPGGLLACVLTEASPETDIERLDQT
ncbi:MAG TPA: hypothetical protein PKE12_03435 [Kiritimatiellia bacterium]|nr:hypothetical protein [Kiritimatiellia bacterium]